MSAMSQQSILLSRMYDSREYSVIITSPNSSSISGRRENNKNLHKKKIDVLAWTSLHKKGICETHEFNIGLRCMKPSISVESLANLVSNPNMSEFLQKDLQVSWVSFGFNPMLFCVLGLKNYSSLSWSSEKSFRGYLFSSRVLGSGYLCLFRTNSSTGSTAS